jgi:dipeptidyl aminopeptidase/acylaminoacyl peptidase
VRRPAYFDSEQRFLVAEVFGKDPDAYLFHRQYYRFPLDGGEPIQLTPEDATHEPWFAPDGRFFVDNYSRADQAPRAVLRNLSGELVMELEEMDIEPLRAMGFQMQEYFTAKAADGETDLFGVLWKPADFDPARSYPVIAAVQPNASISAADVARFRPGNVAVQLSQLGFVVVELKTRGQGRHVRDKQFILHSYQNDRDYPLADAKAVIEQLTARHSYLDASRVGAYGHSGGGFMSAALCMKYPALFKVCVSSSGNHDNRIAEQNSTEFHWGVTRATGKDGAEWLVNLQPNQELAGGLEGHLLIIHGDNDTDTHFSQSVRLADALIKAGKKFDFMIMPSQDHAYKGVYNEYFDRLRWAYFAEHLMGDTRNLIDLKNL